MKKLLAFGMLLFLSVVGLMSCSKDDPATPDVTPRTIKFILYTEKDFSSDNGNITFSLFIRNTSRTLFDSALSTIKVKDIPNKANKLVFEKVVPNDDGTLLTAGFNYTIENVGDSWYLDTCSVGQPYKVIDYSFK